MQLTTNERETLLLNTWKKSTHQKDSMQREGGGGVEKIVQEYAPL